MSTNDQGISTRAIFYLASIISLGIYYGPPLYESYLKQSICEQGRLRKVNLEALPAIIKDLQSPETCLRSVAALQIQDLGEAAEPAFVYILPLLEDPADDVRWRATAAIGHIKKRTPETDAMLVKLTKDPNSTVRYNSVFSLRETGAEGKHTALLPLLKDSDEKVVRQSVLSLRRFKSAQNPETIKQLNEFLLVAEPDVKPLVNEALAFLKQKDTIDSMLDALGGHDKAAAATAKHELINIFKAMAANTSGDVISLAKADKIFSALSKMNNKIDASEIADRFAPIALKNQLFRDKIAVLSKSSDANVKMLASRMLFKVGIK